MLTSSQSMSKQPTGKWWKTIYGKSKMKMICLNLKLANWFVGSPSMHPVLSRSIFSRRIIHCIAVESCKNVTNTSKIDLILFSTLFSVYIATLHFSHMILSAPSCHDASIASEQ